MNSITSERLRSIIFSDGESPLRFHAAFMYDVERILLFKEPALDHFYEPFRQLPHIMEVEESWRAACALQYFGLPIDKRETTIEEEFFYELRVSDTALSQYSKLIAKHAKRNDFEFFKRIVSAQKRPRGRPKAKGLLYSILLSGWLYAGLWLMTNDDRVKFIEHALGFPVETKSGLPDERVMKAVQRLGLLSWWDFPDTYLEAPVKYELYRNKEAQFGFIDRWIGLWERTEMS